MQTYDKPLPRAANPRLTQPFWDAAKRHELVIQRCRMCAKFFFYPREQCPDCLSTEVEWSPVSGKGRLYSYVVVHQAADPGFKPTLPHVYAIVQLDEGVKMISNVVDCEIDDVHVDMPLEVRFDDVTADWTLVKFGPRES